MMRYKIVEVNAAEHSIVVRYYTDTITEAMLASQTDDAGNILRCRTDYNITLPIPTPEGAALEDFIIARAPVQWLQTMEAVQNDAVDTSLSTVTALLNVEKTFAA
jgi:hypothetical protein